MVKKYLIVYVRYTGNDHYGWKSTYFGEETVDAENIVDAHKIATEHLKGLDGKRGIKNIKEICLNG